MPEEKRGYMGRFETILLIIVGLLVTFMLCLMFIPVAVHADEIHMEVMLEIGYDYTWDIINTDIDLELHIPLVWDFKAICYGGVETLSTPADALSFQPEINAYDFGASLRIDNFDFFIEHFCIHPADDVQFLLYGYRNLYIQGGTKFGIRYDTRYKLKDTK
jgi:hypothetical protein